MTSISYMQFQPPPRPVAKFPRLPRLEVTHQRTRYSSFSLVPIAANRIIYIYLTRVILTARARAMRGRAQAAKLSSKTASQLELSGTDVQRARRSRSCHLLPLAGSSFSYPPDDVPPCLPGCRSSHSRATGATAHRRLGER